MDFAFGVCKIVLQEGSIDHSRDQDECLCKKVMQTDQGTVGKLTARSAQSFAAACQCKWYVQECISVVLSDAREQGGR